MSVGVAEKPAESSNLHETIDSQTLSDIEAAGLYKGDVGELSAEEREVLEALAEIKNTALNYAQGSAFLQDKLYPPERWPGHEEVTHTVEVSADENELWIHRTALLDTAAGRMMLDVASQTDEDELIRLGEQANQAQKNGIVNHNGEGFSDWYKQAEFAMTRSGIATAEERQHAVVTFGLVDGDEVFELNGSVQKRLDTGESCVVEGQLLDPQKGVVDTKLFAAVADTLDTRTGKNLQF